MKDFNLQNPNVRILSVLLITLMLMSCGSNKGSSGSTEESSRIADDTNIAQDVQPLAYCSEGVNAAQSMRLNVSAQMGTSGKIDPNYVHVKISNVPSTFSDGSKYIVFWKWYAESSGYTYVSQTPLNFKLVNIQTGQEISSLMNRITWSSISTLATQMGVTTPTAFFQRIRLFVELQDPSAQYDAITVGFHNYSTGAIEDRIDSLLPVFDADPRRFATESSGAARAQILKDYHPFSGMEYSQWSAATFYNKALDLCIPLTQY